MKTRYIVLTISIIILIVFIATFVIKKPFIGLDGKSRDIEISEIQMGSVIKTVPAEGVIEPENEVLLLSPAPAVISKIENGPGSKVQRGDVLLRLETETILDQIEDLEDQLEVKKNNLEKTKLSARGVRVDLGYNMEVKKLKIVSLKSELVDQEQLLEVGGISPAKFDKTKQELTLAEKDLETIQEKNAIRLEQLATEEKGLELQINIQEKELEDKKELLSRMIIRAMSDGIVLEINGKEGEKVNKDRLLVRMSDLSTYKISATIDDKMDDAIKTGKDVFALVDNEKLAGKIGNINPVIKDRKIEFDVYLQQSNYAKLRPNLAVELQVVIARRDSVPRILLGPSIGKGDDHEIYKLDAGKAILTPVQTGVRGDEYIEVRSGLDIGDRIITSDISGFRKLQEIDFN